MKRTVTQSEPLLLKPYAKYSHSSDRRPTDRKEGQRKEGGGSALCIFFLNASTCLFVHSEYTAYAQQFGSLFSATVPSSESLFGSKNTEAGPSRES